MSSDWGRDHCKRACFFKFIPDAEEFIRFSRLYREKQLARAKPLSLSRHVSMLDRGSRLDRI